AAEDDDLTVLTPSSNAMLSIDMTNNLNTETPICYETSLERSQTNDVISYDEKDDDNS
ncbi:unnamed protein product, partial [Cercopithifilaria johnstoni]